MIEKYLNNRFSTLYLFPFLIGSLTVFTFQPFNLTFLNFIILPLLFYLVVYIKKKSKSKYRKKPYKKNLLIFGTFFGIGFYLAGIHWIVNSLTFDESFKVFIPFGLVLIPLFLSLFFSLSFVIVGPFLNLNLGSILIFSASLSFSDYLRAKIFTGFPWNLWAYSLSWNLEVIQVLNILGLFAFNLISITIFILPSILFFKLSLSKKLSYLFIIPLILFTFYIYGNHSLNQNEKRLKEIEEKHYIKVISPDFDLEYGLTDEKISKRLKKLIRISDPNKNLQTLFIWPEGIFSGYSFEEISNLKETFKKNFNKNHLILFGINRKSREPQGFFNSLIIVNHRLEIISEYKKQKLVPFGEFIPLEKVLSRIGLKKVTEGQGSFLKGIKQENLIIDNLNILPLICYEVIFTEFVQQSDKNTNLIINISEDGWFGNSIGPYQHFTKGIFRAIEQNSFLIRSANRGISAIINNKGEIIKKLNLKEAGNIELDVPLIKSSKKTKKDLIFFILLITYIFVFNFYKK